MSFNVYSYQQPAEAQVGDWMETTVPMPSPDPPCGWTLTASTPDTSTWRRVVTEPGAQTFHWSWMS